MRRWADEALVQVVFVAWRHYSFTGTKADLSSRKSRGIYMRAIPLEILSMLQNYTLKKTTIYFPIEQLKCIWKYRKTTFMSHNMMTCWYHADAFYVYWEANTECYNDVTWRPSWFKSPPIRIFVHIFFRISKKQLQSSSQLPMSERIPLVTAEFTTIRASIEEILILLYDVNFNGTCKTYAKDLLKLAPNSAVQIEIIRIHLADNVCLPISAMQTRRPKCKHGICNTWNCITW